MVFSLHCFSSSTECDDDIVMEGAIMLFKLFAYLALQEAEKKVFQNWPPTNEEFAVVLKLFFWYGYKKIQAQRLDLFIPK